MKKFIPLSFAILLAGLSHAQVKVTDFTEPDLKGHVKKVIQYDFYKTNDFNVDTINYDLKNILTFDTAGFRTSEVNTNKKFGYSDAFTFEHTDSTITRNQFFNGKLAVKYIYKYNKQGKETEFDTNMLGGNIVTPSTVKIYYTYDKDGNRIEDKQYHEQNLMSDDTYKYNKAGQQIKMDSKRVGFSQGGETIFKYDSVGNIIKKLTYDLDGNKISETTVFYGSIDKNGNWLERKYLNTLYQQNTVTIRLINYY